jgi:hypothetical protein
MMAKRLAVLVAALAGMLATAIPALAQEGYQYDQYGGDRAELLFELAVEGDPPENATFFGNVSTGEGGPGLFVPLTDPDGDGLYAGSTSVDRYGPGPRPVPPGVEPLSFPVRIVQGTGTQGQIAGEPVTVIQNFGVVPMEDRTFSADVSFDDGGQNGPLTSSGTSDGEGRALPATGGAALVLLVGGALLICSGLLAHRVSL